MTDAKLRLLIEDEIEAALGHRAQLLTILHANLNTRAFPDTELNLTKLDLIVRVNDGGYECNVSLRFDAEKLDKFHYGVIVPEEAYAFRTFRIFWGNSIPNGYNIRHHRYGHGIGLSQNGARGRCAEGQDHYDILQFYMPNMEVATVSESNPEVPHTYTKPTVAHGTIKTDQAQLRAGASMDDPVLETLPHGTYVNVITEVNGWLVCIVNNKLGYIRGDFVSVYLFPAPTGGSHIIGTAYVPSGVLDAQLRVGPSEYSAPLFTLYPGVGVTVWHRIGEWYHIRFAGRYAFIHSSKITELFWPAQGLQAAFEKRCILSIDLSILLLLQEYFKSR